MRSLAILVRSYFSNRTFHQFTDNIFPASNEYDTFLCHICYKEVSKSDNCIEEEEEDEKEEHLKMRLIEMEGVNQSKDDADRIEEIGQGVKQSNSDVGRRKLEQGDIQSQNDIDRLEEGEVKMSADTDEIYELYEMYIRQTQGNF